MPDFDYDLGVLGGGSAGLTAAAGAARLGARTLLVEKEPVLGGDCLHFGCVPSKTLIRTAQVLHEARNAQAYGLPGLDLPPVDFAKVTGRIREVIARIQEHDSPERFCSLGVKVLFGQARFVDEHAMVLDGKRLSAAKWIIATGSSPAMPDLPGLAQVSCLTNRELFSLPSLPESMIVLGGGAVACEMAQAFARLGCLVTIIQRGEHLLSGEDPDMAAMVQDRLSAEGVSLHLGTKVKQVKENYGLKEVAFTEQSGQERTVSAQALLVAMGRTPNLDGLDLEKAGVARDAKGLIVDARLRTSRPHIFGAGDVLGRWLFTHAAGYEASVALTNAVMRLPRKADYTLMPKATFTDPELAGIGLTAKAAGPGARVLEESFADNDRALAEGHGLGKIKMILDEREKILGIHILGPRAGDLICEWVAALAGKVRLSTLAQAVHPYPTLAEINKRLAGAVMAPKLFEGPVPKILKILFGLKSRAC